MNRPIRMAYFDSHPMQVWFDEHRFQAYRQWRRKQGLPPEDKASARDTLAREIVSVQPMSLPTGLVFYMDQKFNTNENADKTVTP